MIEDVRVAPVLDVRALLRVEPGHHAPHRFGGGGRKAELIEAADAVVGESAQRPARCGRSVIHRPQCNEVVERGHGQPGHLERGALTRPGRQCRPQCGFIDAVAQRERRLQRRVEAIAARVVAMGSAERRRSGFRIAPQPVAPCRPQRMARSGSEVERVAGRHVRRPVRPPVAPHRRRTACCRPPPACRRGRR